MNFIEAIRLASENKIIIARENSAHLQGGYLINDDRLHWVDPIWEKESETVYWVWAPEYTGFEDIDLEDVLADNWYILEENWDKIDEDSRWILEK